MLGGQKRGSPVSLLRDPCASYGPSHPIYRKIELIDDDERQYRDRWYRQMRDRLID